MRSVELLAFVLVSAHLVRIDIAHHRLPNRYTGLLALCLAVIAMFDNSWLDNILSALTASGTLLLLHLVRSNSLGLGDVKYAWSCGWVLANTTIALTAIWLAFLFAGIANLPKLFRCSKQRIAFGPYLFVATIALIARHLMSALVEMA